MSYEAGKPITGFTLTLDATLSGSSEAVENILQAAFAAMQKEVEKAERAYFGDMVKLGPSTSVFKLQPPWPVKGEIKLRTGS